MQFQPRHPHFSAFWTLSSPVVCGSLCFLVIRRGCKLGDRRSYYRCSKWLSLAQRSGSQALAEVRQRFLMSYMLQSLYWTYKRRNNLQMFSCEGDPDGSSLQCLMYKNSNDGAIRWRTSLPKVIWEEGRVAALSHTYVVKSPLVTMARPKFAPQKYPFPWIDLQT